MPAWMDTHIQVSIHPCMHIDRQTQSHVYFNFPLTPLYIIYILIISNICSILSVHKWLTFVCSTKPNLHILIQILE